MEIKVHENTKYRFHSTLDGIGFWMPEQAWLENWAKDFFTAKDGIEYCQGLPFDFLG